MLQPRGFRADKSLSHAEIEALALRRRRLLAPNRRLDEPLGCDEIFERIDEYHVDGPDGPIRLDYGTATLPDGVEGQTRFDARRKRIVIELTEGTYRGLKEGKPRARMTFPHELGHADLHTAQIMRISHIPHNVMAFQREMTDPHPFYRDTEWQADAYAGALLMPAKAIASLERRHKGVTIRQLQDTFHVSFYAAGIRLDNYQKRKRRLTAIT